MTDSGSHTWVESVVAADTEFCAAAIFTCYFASAPGSITVTAASSVSGSGVMVTPIVLDGAASSQAGAATGTADSPSSTSTIEGSITTTTVGSWVLTVGSLAGNGGTYTPSSLTSNLDTPYNDSTEGATYLAGKQTAATVTPGATTLGWTGSSGGSDMAWCALEILPAGSSTAPVAKSRTTAQAVRRAAYY